MQKSSYSEAKGGHVYYLDGDYCVLISLAGDVAFFCVDSIDDASASFSFRAAL